jgi:PP-loop superfamily ATP-utilizing enzyme
VTGPRTQEAERRLAEIGLDVRVDGAGSAGEVALIRAEEDQIGLLLSERRQAAIEACRAAGFRYVTLELC